MEEKIKYEINPNFNLLYEFFMPTGRKIKNTFIAFLVLAIATLWIFLNGDVFTLPDIKLMSNISIFELLKWLCLIITILLLVKLVFHIIFQKLQYNHISYKFYDTYLVYEDDFLNQHRKNIEYKNIKEVEIRRTIWDRILGYGVIVIYTNAENKRGNGLVVYAIKNPKEVYDIIDEIINVGKQMPSSEIDKQEEKIVAKEEKITKNQIQNEEQMEVRKSKEQIDKEQKDFINSLKNINK